MHPDDHIACGPVLYRVGRKRYGRGPPACYADCATSAALVSPPEADMRRTILLAGALPFVSAFLGGVLALSVAAPRLVDAQEARIRAEALTITGAGTDRVRLGTKWDGQGGDLSMF